MSVMHLEVQTYMSQDVIDNSPETEIAPQPLYRNKVLLYLAVLVLAVNFLWGLFSGPLHAKHQRTGVTASLVSFNGPAGSYQLRYDPTLFKQVPSHDAGNTSAFVAKGGHASFTASTSSGRPVTIAMEFYQDEVAYRTQVPSVFLTGHNLRPDHYVITARSFHLVGNRFYVERAVLHGNVLSKLRIQYDSGCDSTCESALRQTAESFLDSSPY
jgi:hypothetical protein